MSRQFTRRASFTDDDHVSFIHRCVAQVTRAEALLRNLEQERDRWSMSSESFTKQLESLIGDGLLAAAFVTYVGVFDYRTRKVRTTAINTAVPRCA